MILFRLCKSKYSNDLSGTGAEKAGGRWNSKGVAVVYTSSSRSLCMAEISVHLPLGIIPEDFVIVTIEIPDSIIPFEITHDLLPANWNSLPHSAGTQKAGDEFLTLNKYLLSKVPSAVVQGEFNYLINPNHRQINKVKIKNMEDFKFDKRLFKKV